MNTLSKQNLIQTIFQQQIPKNLNDQLSVEMIIELEGQRSAKIIINANDDAQTLAKLFCYKNNVEPKIISSLSRNIRNAQVSLLREQQNNKQNISTSKNHSSTLQEIGNTITKHNQREGYSLSEVNHEENTLYWSGSVFDRLYHDSKCRMTTKISKRIDSSHRMRRSEKMQFTELYERNIQYVDNIHRKNQQLRQQKQKRQLEQCFHKPKINRISQQIAKRSNVHLQSTKAIRRQKQLLSYLRQKQIQQLQQCTFQPKLISKSHLTTIPQNRHLLLYEDHTLRIARKKNNAQHYLSQITSKQSFINPISDQILSKKTFFQRLQQYKQNQLQNLQKIKKKSRLLNKSRNYKNNNQSLPNRNPQKLQIGQYLYSQSKSKNINHSKQTNKMQYNAIQKSKIIYEQMKFTAFRYIFSIMDSNQDGIICSKKINVFGIDTQVLKLISPLLCEMQEMEAQLNEQQFIECIDRLFQTLSIDQKNKILKAYKQSSRVQFEHHSFEPQLNQHSLQLAKKFRNSKQNLYDLWRSSIIEKQNKMNQLRAYKQQRQQQQCTFYPNIAQV